MHYIGISTVSILGAGSGGGSGSSSSINVVIDCRASLTCAVSTAFLFAPSITAEASVGASVVNSINIPASIDAEASVVAPLTLIQPLSASIDASAALSTSIFTSIAIPASITAEASVVASVVNSIAIPASIEAEASLTSNVVAPDPVELEVMNAYGISFVDYEANGISAASPTWVEADSVVTSGSDVTTIVDKSGTGDNYSKAGGVGNQPQLVSSVYNGRPVIRFIEEDAVYFSTVANANTYLDNDSTAFLVYLSSHSVGEISGVFEENAAPNERVVFYSENRSVAPFRLLNYSVDALANPIDYPAQIFPGVLRLITYVKSGANISAWDNGNLIGSTTDLGQSFTGNTNFSIGRQQAGGLQFDGDFAFMLVENGAASTAHRQNMEILIADRFGIPIAGASWLNAYNELEQAIILQEQYYKDQVEGGALDSHFYLALEADHGVTTSGSDVTVWTDKYNAVAFIPEPASNDNSPALLTNSLNGNPVISFDRNNQESLSAPSTTMQGLNTFQIVMVVKPVTTDGNSVRALNKGVGTSGNREFLLAFKDDAGDYLRVNVFNDTSSSNTVVDINYGRPLFGEWQLVTMYYDDATDAINGDLYDLSGSDTATQDIEALNDRLKIARSVADAAGDYSSLDVAAVICLVDDTYAEDAKLYLANKYGLAYDGAQWLEDLADPMAKAVCIAFGITKDEHTANTFSNYITALYESDFGLSTTGNLVNSWADKSGNSNTFTSSGANRPTLLPADSRVNGLPAVYFNGAAGEYWLEAAAALVNPQSNFTFIGAYDTFSVYAASMASNLVTYSSAIIFGGHNSDTSLWMNSTAADRIEVGVERFGLYTVISRLSPDEVQLYQDTVSLETINPSRKSTVGGTVLGARADKTTSFYEGIHAVVLIVDYDISETQRNTLEAAIVSKYNPTFMNILHDVPVDAEASVSAAISTTIAIPATVNAEASVSAVVQSSQYSEEYQAVLDRATTQGYTQPSEAQRTLQNTLMQSFVSTAAWAAADSVAVFMTDGDSNFALINWKNPTATGWATENTVTFTSNLGFTTNGTDSRLFDSTTFSNHTQNSAGVIFYLPSDAGGNDYITNISSNGASGKLVNTNATLIRFNSTTNNGLLLGQWGGLTVGGVRAVVRNGSTTGFVRADEFTASGTIATSTANSPIDQIGKRNTLYGAVNIGIIWVGGAFSEADFDTIRAAIDTYVAAI